MFSLLLLLVQWQPQFLLVLSTINAPTSATNTPAVANATESAYCLPQDAVLPLEVLTAEAT